ncbi:MAG: hypothetical protein GYA12_07230 [Chloroflexi bacterium]|nr:hypothetical protein [Chloroflexota bacterium]BCY19205.1 hypothetical protein hrd7_30540 [Leptolinea sp. HRD-7]
MFSIHSASSDRQLIFSNFNGEKFQVEIHGSGLNSTKSIWHDEHYSGLDEFFKYLAQSTSPWANEQKWESLEGDFSITAACSRTGAVTFTIGILHMAGNEEEARIRVGLLTELGQLETIARDAVKFFKR